MEWDNHDNWRQQHWLTCINRIPKRYIEVFEAYDLNNHITKATRIGKRLIDCIISNSPANRILHSDVLPCPTISDHGAPYIIANVLLTRNKIQLHLRNLKNIELEKYVHEFKVLPISLVYSFDEPNDQLHTLNKLNLNTITELASLRKTTFARPPAHWMK